MGHRNKERPKEKGQNHVRSESNSVDFLKIWKRNINQLIKVLESSKAP